MIRELVSPVVYNYYKHLYGEDFIWVFFPEHVLKELDFIHEEWGRYLNSISIYKYTSKSIIINNWSFGGNITQRGLRCNLDQIVKDKNVPYVSGHCLGIAFDLEPANKLYKVFHDFLWNLMISGKLKFFKRLENFKNTPTWSHIDGIRTLDEKPLEFNIL